MPTHSAPHITITEHETTLAGGTSITDHGFPIALDNNSQSLTYVKEMCG